MWKMGGKSVKMVTVSPSVVRIREAAKRRKAGCREGARYNMIEAFAHDLGKASQARFEDHAEASVELLRKAGFEDAAVLRLIARHHKSSGDDDSNLYLLFRKVLDKVLKEPVNREEHVEMSEGGGV